MSFSEFYKNYICLNLKDYPNLKLDLEINKYLIATLLGLIIAIILINYMRSTVYLTVNKLLRHEAISEDSAKTLDELGINLGKVKRCLMSASQLKSIVAQVGETRLSYEEYREKVRENKKLKNKEPIFEKIDFENARFYIRKDQLNVARELSFKSRSIVLNTVLFCALTVVIMICLVFLMPEILNFINGFMG